MNELPKNIFVYALVEPGVMYIINANDCTKQNSYIHEIHFSRLIYHHEIIKPPIKHNLHKKSFVIKRIHYSVYLNFQNIFGKGETASKVFLLLPQ